MRVVLVLLLCAMTQQVWAQTVVRGTIRDAETEETLPAANIQIANTYQGTISNEEGRFELRIAQPLPATLIIRYIGYQTRSVDIVTQPEGDLEIVLDPVTYQMEELLVTGEDPAINIMRKVIEKKQVWRELLSTYRAEAYNRFTMANDTGIVSVMESLTDTFWDKERGMKEIVKSQRRTSNMAYDEFIPAALFVTNLYDDNIDIAGYEMIGVTHPKALNHYDFSLEGTRRIDDQLVYDISVTPRNKFKSAFKGRVAVLDEAYALIEVELEPGEAFIFPPPIMQYDVKFRQQFSDFGGQGAFWLPVDYHSEFELRISFQGLLAFPTFHVQQTSKITNYVVNTGVPDSLYESEDFLAVDTAAVEADTLLDRGGLIVPLSVKEVEAYDTIDSTMTLEKAYAPTGPLARFVDMEEEDGGGGGNGGGGTGPFKNLDLTPDVWFNRVDEANLGLQATYRISRRLSINGSGGYKTGLERWDYGGGATVRFGARRRGTVHLSYRHAVDTRFPTLTSSRLLNSATVLLGGTDYNDYYANERIHTHIGYYIRRWDALIEGGLRLETHDSVAKTTDYDFLGSHTLQRDNPAIDEGQLRAARIKISINDDEVPMGLIGQKRLILQTEHSPGGFLGSDFSYSRFDLLLEWRFVTLLKRRLIPNTLDVRLIGTTFAGTLPIQRLGVVETGRRGLTPFGTLRSLATYPFEGEQVLAGFWEHSFRTLPFELIGLDRLTRMGLNLLVHGAHGKTWISDTRVASLPYIPHLSKGWYHEMGVSLSGLFSIFRVDFTHQLNGSQYAFGLSAARIF